MSEIYFTTVGLKTVGVKCSIMEEEEKRENGTGRRRNERVRGEEEEGEADHGERSCFYSLSFLAEAEDILSTDGVYLVGQAAFYCILLYCILLRVDVCV